MIGRLKFFFTQLREKLWVKPLLTCFLSLGAVFLVKAVDYREISDFVPDISPETIETLLKISASSMLVIATFAVGSMVSSYSSASATATPRSLALVISDDVSQNALSRFIGAFIFSIVALIALLNEYYEKGALFVLFCLTVLVLMIVVLTFVRWVDCIARLGRLGTTVDKVEAAAASAIRERKEHPSLGGRPPSQEADLSRPLYGTRVGYVQRVDVARLHKWAKKAGTTIRVAALPGSFSSPSEPLAYLLSPLSDDCELAEEELGEAFHLCHDRTFAEDPRFGLITLSEIASRALSPAVNDPGTAISVIGTLVRLFHLWDEPVEQDSEDPPYDRVEVPPLCLEDLFDDAFLAISRDGAGMVEVGIRLQKAFRALSIKGSLEMQAAAQKQAALAFDRAAQSLSFPADLAKLEAVKWRE